MTCAPGKDSDQPGHSLNSLWTAKNSNLPLADSEDTDQTGHLSSLILVFAGRTYQFIGFVMLWLQEQLISNLWNALQ